MDKMREYFTDLEYKLFELSLKVANAVGQHLHLSDRTYIAAIDRLLEARLFFGRYEAMSKEYHGPTDFDAALKSPDFATRHVVANKIVMGFLVENYEADDALLLKAAEVLLEGYQVTHADTSRLVSVWKASRGQTSEEGAFLDGELALFDELKKNGKAN